MCTSAAPRKSRMRSGSRQGGGKRGATRGAVHAHTEDGRVGGLDQLREVVGDAFGTGAVLVEQRDVLIECVIHPEKNTDRDRDTCT